MKKPTVKKPTVKELESALIDLMPDETITTEEIARISELSEERATEIKNLMHRVWCDMSDAKLTQEEVLRLRRG